MWRYRKRAGWALLAGGFGGRGRPIPAGSVFTADPGSIGAAPLRPRLQRWLRAALERSPRRWMGGDSRPFSERLGTDPPRQSLLFFRVLVAAPPPSEVWGYTLSRACHLSPFSFEPLWIAPGQLQPNILALALVLVPWRTSAPTLPPFLDVLAPPNPIKCPITYKGSSWNLQRKSQATPRIGKYRFRISLDPAAPLPSLSRMLRWPSFPDVLQFRRLWSLWVSTPGKVRGSLALRSLKARPPSESDAVILCPGASGLQRLNFIGWQSRSPRERKINMAGAPLWPKSSGRFSRTGRETRSNQSGLASAAQVALDREGK